MRARFVSIIFCVVALAFPALAAQNRRGAPSLDRVLPQIRQSMPGTFYDAEGPFLSADGQATYRIKWMTPDGRMVWFSVDARSGQVLGASPGTAPNHYRGDDSYPSRTNSWNDGAPSGYGDRDRNSGWDRGASRGGNQGWSREDRDGREQSPAPSNSGRYERSPDRGTARDSGRGSDHSPDRSSTRGSDRGKDRSQDNNSSRSKDRGRDRPHNR